MIDKTRLAAAFTVTLSFCACSVVTPPDEAYFRSHADEARLVITRCERGQESGSDCKAAAKAVATLDADVKNASTNGIR